MSASDDVPFFSRFVVKFLEIFAAGLATAISGYLIAHLAGALSSSTPTAVGAATQVAPGAGAVSSTLAAKPPAPASAGVSEQHPVPAQETNAPAAAQPAQVAEPSHEPSHADAAKAAVAHKRPEADTHLEADKHLDADKHLEADKHLAPDASGAASAAEGKRDQEENKQAQDAVLARIRAALANSTAKRANPPDAPQPPATGPRSTAAIGPQSSPVDKRPSTPPGAAPVTSASPGFANPPPPIQQPVAQQVQPPLQQQQPPAEPSPLTTVEIPSRPVATVQTAPAPAPAATTQDDTGMFSGLDRLRHDPLAASEDAPRPPMPVGQ
jgi:hypothetical protein